MELANVKFASAARKPISARVAQSTFGSFHPTRPDSRELIGFYSTTSSQIRVFQISLTLMFLRRLFLACLAILLVCVGLSGCASLPRADAFDVSLVNLSPAQSTVFESQLVVTLRYTNESNTPLALTGSRHKLYLNGRAVGTAVSGEHLTIPALATTTQDLTLSLSHFALVGLVREVQSTRAVRYEIASTLYLGGISRGLNATHEGNIDLSAFSAAASAAPTAY